MNTRTSSTKILLATAFVGLALLFGGTQIALAQSDLPPLDDTGGAATANIPAENSLQNPGCSMFSISVVDCIAGPLAKWTSSLMLSLGGSILRLAGAIFDFGVNHVIINFKNTLSGPLLDIINSGWTFFRDLANILIIGIFVFIAISLILGLKEYGQKKLVARVLIIAVLMNFSLLFTKIIIDASNFMAYAIYSQTAGAGGTGTFSIADKVLAPLHVTGTWDTAAVAQSVYDQAGGGAGALKAFSFGLFGFLILTVLAAVIFYGAFLIIARAIMFVFLMLTAPIAYATYLAPNFEASQFGWSNWWKSLINNAAFAPLLMMFLSVSILIMQSASPSINPADTIGAFLTDPPKQILADGWRVIFVYILGTGLLFASFRLSSSLAGSISGIKVGQMAAGIPLAFGARGAGFLGQRSVGWAANKSATSKASQASAARLSMNTTNDAKEKEFFRKQAEKFERQKGRRDALAGSSFNMMNTGLGKAAAGSAGLSGALAGEKKGSFKDTAEARSKAAQERAAQTNLTDDDKAKVRAEAEKNVEAKFAPQRDAATAKVAAAEQKLEDAKKERATISDAVVTAAKAAVETNRSARSSDVAAAAKELAEAESSHSKTIEGHDKEIADLAAREHATTGAAKDAITQQLIERRAAHTAELDMQKRRIETARSRITEINEEIEAPLIDIKIADGKIAHRQSELATAQGEHAHVEQRIKTARKTEGEAAVKKITTRADEYQPERFHQIAKEEAGYAGADVAHKIEHDLAHKYKSKKGTEKLLDALKKGIKSDEAHT